MQGCWGQKSGVSRERNVVDGCCKTHIRKEIYSNIGQNRISSLLKEPRCPFVLYVGTKKLVKRKEFEKFISESVEI